MTYINIYIYIFNNDKSQVVYYEHRLYFSSISSWCVVHTLCVGFVSSRKDQEEGRKSRSYERDVRTRNVRKALKSYNKTCITGVIE